MISTWRTVATIVNWSFRVPFLSCFIKVQLKYPVTLPPAQEALQYTELGFLCEGYLLPFFLFYFHLQWPLVI